jgi:hypothetical protein
VWTFFSEPVAAADARAMGAALLHEAMAIRGEMDIESYDRLFPAQDYLPRRGFGNLIALPLEGRCRQNRTTLFVDPATFEPYQDQFAYLSSLERMTRRDVVERAEELQPPTVGPAVRLHRSPLAAELPPPDVIKAELSGMLAIRRAGLPPSLLSSLKHLASLHNPEFYSRQQIGLSVWGAPRMLRCYSESLDRLFLPRGVADRAAKLIEKAGSRLAITDLRSAPAKLEIEFTGTLRAEQQAAVDAVAAYELGVLVAPPGAGKTVMGCGVIARHKVPTLILVDRTPLVDQWKERLREHLGLGPKDIGQLGGGKKTKLTGLIDLATLQSLTRAADPAAILCEYGLVIVDECHHVAAHTFARAIQSIPARRWLGLTATPKRADGREEIMFMHCGQVRHKIPSATDLIQELHVHPTATTIRDDIDSDTPGILQSIIIPALVSDRIRTAQIIDDVVHAIRRGRNCLMMAGRSNRQLYRRRLRLPSARHALPVLTVLLGVDHHAERRPDHARSAGENDGRGTRLRRHQGAHADPHAREEAYRLQEDRIHQPGDRRDPAVPRRRDGRPSASAPIQTRCRLGSASQGVGEGKRSRRLRPRPPAPRDLGTVPPRASTVIAHSSCRRERHVWSHS